MDAAYETLVSSVVIAILLALLSSAVYYFRQGGQKRTWVIAGTAAIALFFSIMVALDL